MDSGAIVAAAGRFGLTVEKIAIADNGEAFKVYKGANQIFTEVSRRGVPEHPHPWPEAEARFHPAHAERIPLRRPATRPPRP